MKTFLSEETFETIGVDILQSFLKSKKGYLYACSSSDGLLN